MYGVPAKMACFLAVSLVAAVSNILTTCTVSSLERYAFDLVARIEIVSSTPESEESGGLVATSEILSQTRRHVVLRSQSLLAGVFEALSSSIPSLRTFKPLLYTVVYTHRIIVKYHVDTHSVF
jgi:hypothetical protein